MKEIIKKRTILVDGMTCEGCENRINSTISKLDGIKTIKADKVGKVYVEYDLMKINLETIEKTISELNYKTSQRFFDRFKRSWLYYLEKNEYDNITYSCCSDSCCSG